MERVLQYLRIIETQNLVLDISWYFLFTSVLSRKEFPYSLKNLCLIKNLRGFLRWLSGKESACQAVDSGSIPGSEEPPEEETATHSSILAWRIPWTEEPGGLQSMGLQRVRYDLVTKPPPPRTLECDLIWK